MEKALFFILALFVIKSCFAIHCYVGHGADPKNWEKVECNLGTCVKIQVPLDEQRYCLQGLIMNTCSNVDNTAVMRVSLQTIKTMLTFFFVLYRVPSQIMATSDASAILTCAMDL